MAEMKRDRKDDSGPKARRPVRTVRSSTGSVIKTLLIVAILGVLVGLGIVYKDQLLAMVQKKEPAVVKAPPPAPAPPAQKAEVIADLPPKPTAPDLPPLEKKLQIETATKAVSAVDDGEARALIGQGKALLEKFEFGKAAVLFKEAGGKQISPPVKAEAAQWAGKAENFDKATRHIPVSKFALAETTCIIHTQDGRELHGIKKSENDEQIVLQVIPPENPATLGESSFPLPKADIARCIEVPLQKRQADFLRMLGELESSATAAIQSSTDYYDLVYISKRLGLGRECAAYLARAYDGGPGHKPDHYLGDSFRKEVIRRVIDRCSLMLAGGRPKRFAEAELEKLLKMFPGYGAAQDEVEAFRLNVVSKIRDDFKSTIQITERKSSPPKAGAKPSQKTAKEVAMADEQLEFVVESGGVQGKGASAPIVEKANARYEEGMKLYRGFRQGTNGNNNQILRSAMACLQDAVNLYDEALKKDPSNKPVLDRQTEANMIVYACKKYQTL